MSPNFCLQIVCKFKIYVNILSTRRRIVIMEQRFFPGLADFPGEWLEWIKSIVLYLYSWLWLLKFDDTHVYT